MHNSPKDEPAQSVFVPPADQNLPGKETDADEQVHEQLADVPELSGEQDMDELVHEHFSPSAVNQMEENEEEDEVFSGEEDVDEGGEG